MAQQGQSVEPRGTLSSAAESVYQPVSEVLKQVGDKLEQEQKENKRTEWNAVEGDELVMELSSPEPEELDKYQLLPPSCPESPPNELHQDSEDGSMAEDLLSLPKNVSK